MNVPRPHFLLFCDGSYPTQGQAPSSRGRWRFVLEDVEGGDRLEAADAEANQAPDRIALLAVVRGLEALSQPSRVTMITSSRYVQRGMQYGLPEWRENDYCWEHFGAQQPIRNADLWRRIDRALQFHTVHCRLMSGDETAATMSATPLESNLQADRADSPAAPHGAQPGIPSPEIGSEPSLPQPTTYPFPDAGRPAIDNSYSPTPFPQIHAPLPNPNSDDSSTHLQSQNALGHLGSKITHWLNGFRGNREVLAGA